jgi:hypothetical protein
MDLDLYSIPWNVNYMTLFFARRFWYVTLALALFWNPCQQIQLLIMSHLLYSIYYGLYKPHQTRSQRSLELLNEQFVVVETYHMIMFSPLVKDQDMKNHVGVSFVGVIFLMIAVNFIKLFSVIFVKMRPRFVRWNAIRIMKNLTLAEKYNFAKNGSLPIK